MTRVLFALLGAGLLVVWLLGILAGASPWLRWADFVAGSFSFLVAMSPVFTGTVGQRDSAGYAWALTALLGIFFIVELTRHATAWLTWTTFAFSLLYACAGFVLARAGQR
jgi:hypothetical protein